MGDPIDISRYLQLGSRARDDCVRVAQGLEQIGVVTVRDRRLPDALHARFQALVLAYFRQPEEVKRRDARPELHHQVGWTPPFTERPKPRDAVIRTISPQHRPHPIPMDASGKLRADPKERFFLPFGTRPRETRYSVLNQKPVVPTGFPDIGIADEWAARMLDAIRTTTEMAAIGFGERPDLFIEIMMDAPHLLAPTGSDLGTHGIPETVLAGFHDDLNFLSGHAKTNCPGLYGWTRSLERFPMCVPDGCLLMQAGQQFEVMTGGRVLCGLHEVVADHTVQPFIDRCRADHIVPWRVSSTLFAHLATDRVLQPIGAFATDAAIAQYPAMDVGAQVLRELGTIELSTT